MKITIENTAKLVTLETDGGSVPARLWEGVTESGMPVICYVTRICPAVAPSDPRIGEFERELTEMRRPSAAVQVIPLRLIL